MGATGLAIFLEGSDLPTTLLPLQEAPGLHVGRNGRTKEMGPSVLVAMPGF